MSNRPKAFLTNHNIYSIIDTINWVLDSLGYEYCEVGLKDKLYFTEQDNRTEYFTIEVVQCHDPDCEPLKTVCDPLYFLGLLLQLGEKQKLTLKDLEGAIDECTL